MLLDQLLAGGPAGKIKRILVAHVARQPEFGNQRLQAAHGLQACLIRTRCSIKAVNLRELRQRTVDFPQQHRGARRGAATARKLTIDDDDIQPLPRQPLGDQRSGDAAADDQRGAFQVFGYGGSIALLRAFKPWRAAAEQVDLLGVVGFEGGNGGSAWQN
jgi:hypothetical protein